MFVLRSFLSGLVFLTPCITYAGSITIDGQTATSISSNAGGGIVVKVAPRNSKSHSHNTYQTFNVPEQGVVFDNSTAGASLILNEVTGQGLTLIEGDVSIRGASADLVFANPNGITVNGGQFLHTGRTLLTTGLRDGENADGLPLYNIQQGSLIVGTKGLTAQGQGVHLYGGDVQVDGNVDVKVGQLDAQSGRGALTVGYGGLLEWLDFSLSGADSSLIVSSGAVLSGGSIRLVSSGGNSGVKMDGIGYASTGNFQIDATGKITISGEVRAQKTVFVNAGSAGIELSGSEDKVVSLVSDTEAVQLISEGGITGQDFGITGAGRGFFGFATNAALSLRASSDVELSKGILVSNASDIEIISEGSADLSQLNFRPSEDLNISTTSGLTLAGVTATSEERIAIESTGGDLKVKNSELASALGSRLKGIDVSLLSDVDQRTRITSSAGGVTVEATGVVLNQGSLIEGAKKSEGDESSEGGVTVHAGQLLRNETVSETSIGSFYANGDSLVIKAGNVENLSGRLLSETDLSIQTSGSIENRVLQIGETHAALSDTKSAANFGDFAVGNEIGQVTAVGNISLKADKKVANIGGDISGQTVSIESAEILNSPERFGAQSFKTRCILFFCKTTGSANVSHDGGTITASEVLSLQAIDNLKNVGGTLTGNDGLVLEAPEIELLNLQFWDSFERPSGLAGFFKGSSSVQILTFQEGVVSSTEGDITLTSDNSVIQRATSLSANGNVNARNGITQEDIDDFVRLNNKREIGFFRFFVRQESK